MNNSRYPEEFKIWTSPMKDRTPFPSYDKG